MLRYRTLPVTPFQQNCSIVWCDRTMEGAVIDPGGDLPLIRAEIDKWAPPADIEKLEASLRGAAVPHRVEWYPGVEHGFVFPQRGAIYDRAAAERHWERLFALFDRIAQVGRTFKYTASGPQGLAGGKTVIVASTRGGIYSTSEWGRAAEHQESYLKTVFGFFGITDVQIVRAEGLAMGDEPKAAAMATARGAIQALAKAAANDAAAVRAA